MNKNVKKILIGVSLMMCLLSFVGCGSNPTTTIADSSTLNKRQAEFLGFDVLDYSKDIDFRIQAILVEKNTKVMYYYTSEFDTGKTMVALLNKDGSPRCYVPTKK